MSHIKFGLVSTSSLLVFALLAEGPSAAQTVAQAQDPNQLPQVDVTTQRPRPQTTARPASKGGSPKRAARPSTPATIPAQTTGPGGPGGTATPLNTNVVAESASRLGLTVREIPASVEVIDQQTIQDRGYHSVIDVAKGAVGVTAADFPGDPAGFSMRGMTDNQVQATYNGIKIGPSSFTALVMETANLQQVEIVKGPATLMVGEGPIGGTVNYVTKVPHTGPVQNEAFVGWDSFGTLRGGFGSGGSSAVQGLDYRFDLSRSVEKGFVDDTNVKNLHLSTQFDYRLSETFKAFVAVEYKDYASLPYWGAPLVSAAFSGPNALNIVSGIYTSFYNGTNLGPVTIDRRTYTTNYNVLDNHRTANEVWVRGGFNWDIASNVRVRSQFYGYDAHREWFNNEVIAFNAGNGLVDRERFFVHHDQKQFGNISDLRWDSNINGMDNRFVTALSFSHLEFIRPAAANFPHDLVTLVDPIRGLYGLLTTRTQTAIIDNVAVSFEDRLKVTQSFALVGGLRLEQLDLDRTSTNVIGVSNAGFPYSKSWQPATGRIGYTWEAIPGMTFYSQYATAADLSAGSIFLLSPTQPLNLTSARTYETGVKDLLWNGRAEWTFSVFDIERKNVYAAQGGQTLNVAGKVQSQGVEFAAAVRPTPETKLWGNVAYVHARYADYEFDGGSFSGNTPPNVPAFVANGGASYQFATAWPVEVGMSVRHVSDRFNTDSNAVKMLGYTTADAYMFVDIVKPWWSTQINKTRVTFRVRNLTNEKYVLWGDPFYADQVLLGAPRSYEVAASFKF
jgi:iron complex outermembrane receptor protein